MQVVILSAAKDPNRTATEKPWHLLGPQPVILSPSLCHPEPKAKDLNLPASEKPLLNGGLQPPLYPNAQSDATFAYKSQNMEKSWK